MAEEKANAKVINIKRPTVEVLDVLGKLKADRLEKEAAEKEGKKGKKAKKAEATEAPGVSFSNPTEALTEVLKATSSVERAESKKAKLGKELGDELKSRKEALAASIENLEGRTLLHNEIREAFAAIETAEERRKSTAATLKKKREEAAAAVEQIGTDAASDLKKVRAAMKALDKAKEEAAAARAAAKAAYSGASERSRVVLSAARQLSLPV
jgi:chromosome segregation ATPase